MSNLAFNFVTMLKSSAIYKRYDALIFRKITLDIAKMDHSKTFFMSIIFCANGYFSRYKNNI